MAAAAVAALLIPLTAVTLPATPAGANTPAPSCAQPVVREAMVSQGLPSYRALARGKKTLVKLFVSQKSGCTAKITIRSGALKVAAGTMSGGQVALANTTTLVELPAYTLAAASASNSDPYFVVPGANLTPTGASELAYTASFSGTLTYDTVHNGITYTGETIPITGLNGAAVSKTVERPSKPLRLLIVPMGDADAIAGYAGVFPDSANSAVRNAMQTMHRMLPVADGIGTVESGAGGLRYTVAPSQQLVDLGPHTEKTSLTGTSTVNYLDANGKYCGSGNSFPYVQQKLAEARNAWNSTHEAAFDVDRVLGVVAQGNSRGPTTGDGLPCADGYAGINAPEAWFRLVDRTSGTDPKFVAGFLGMLEAGHTLGAVPLTRAGADYHSPNNEADGTARERAYNTTRSEYRADDKSTMTYNSLGWNDDNVFFEAADWDLMHCVLVTGTDVSTACPGSEAAVGTTTGAAGVLHAAGLTDGTPGGTNLHTYVANRQDYERPQAAGPYYVRFFLGGLFLREQAVPVYFTYSRHTSDSQSGTSSRGVFDVAVDAGAATSFQFVRRGALGDTVLYSRALDRKPEITQVRRTSTSSGRTPYEQSFGSEGGPDVSPDGKYVAWSTNEEGVHIRRTSDTSGPDTIIPFGYQVSWSNRGDRLAFLVGGRVEIVDLDTTATSGPPAIRSRRTLYTAPVVDGNTVAALHPSWSPDDREIVVTLDRRSIHVLDAEATGVDCLTPVACRAVLTNTDLDWTAWSPARADAARGLIAFERVNPDAPGGYTIQTIDSEIGPESEVSRFAGRMPAWGGGRLAYSNSRGIATVDDTSFGDPQPVDSVPGDIWPSLTADGRTVVYQGSGIDTGFDIFIVRRGEERTEVVVTDDNPDDLRMDVFLDCSGSLAPVTTGLYPQRSGADYFFDVTLDPTASCPNGKPVYRATDGFQTAAENDTVVLAGRTQPVVAVASPRPNDVFNEYATIPVDLDGWAADGTRLAVTYTVTGPQATSSFTSTSAETPDITAYLTPGNYTLTAQATSGPATATQTVPFTILGDNDRDGLPNSVDTRTVHACYPDGASGSAVNAVTDYDGDFLIGRADPDPCRTAFTATVMFEPQTVLLGSSGTPLTFTISSKLDPSQLTAAGIEITRMAGYPVSLKSVSVAVVDNRTVSVKFDRQAYSNLARSLGLISGYVPVTVTLTSSSGSASGADPKYPIHRT